MLRKTRAKTAFNRGFAMRKAILGVSATVNVEIPLNRYSFFESFENKLMPNTRVEIILKIEDDVNIIWQERCRLPIKNFRNGIMGSSNYIYICRPISIY